jgi:threonine/homoserine/homoserine lactone efflux protein
MSNLSTLVPLAMFMAVQSITPGPNNIMLATAGAVAGFRATLPHMLGISFGTAVQIVVLAAGLAPLLQANPQWLKAFALASVAYLVWLAIRLGRAPAPSPGSGATAGRPLSFVGAALFQWINPKAWMMSLTVASVFWPVDLSFRDAAVLTAGVASAINLPCIGLWAVTGTTLRRWLAVGRRWRAFNIMMAVALLGTAVTLLP